MNPIKLLIVAAPSGARADFIAGWLGTTPTFLNSLWNIDPATGISLGHMGNLRGIDHNDQVPSLLANWNLQLSPSATITWAVSCHGPNLDAKLYQSYIDDGSIKFANVDISGADKNHIAWEYLVKTYMSKRRAIDWIGRNKTCLIDEYFDHDQITDQQRTDWLKDFMSRFKFDWIDSHLPVDIPQTRLDFVELFKPQGSRYLCHQLGLTVDDRYHQLWDAMLDFSYAPDEITAWGTKWVKSDWLVD